MHGRRSGVATAFDEMDLGILVREPRFVTTVLQRRVR
jgi:hypothetical protein